MKNYRHLWSVDPSITMLNHGSFGGVPSAVEQWRYALYRQMDANTMRFFLRTIPPMLDESRRMMARLAGTDATNLVFVRNATSGVNAVLRSLKYSSGDEILCTDHGYNACKATVEFLEDHAGVRLILADIPLPVPTEDEIVARILEKVTPRTRIALLDHITSETAVILPIARLIRELESRGVPTLVDAAHAPGMLPLHLDAWRPAYYTANCHKWLCAPRGAAFLYVRPDLRSTIHPTTISHGYNNPHPAAVKYHAEFDWTGTEDLTPWASVGYTIQYLAELGRSLPDNDVWGETPDTALQSRFALTAAHEPDEIRRGINRVMARNHRFVMWAGRLLEETVKSPFSIASEGILGAMYPVVLPDIARERLVSEADSPIFPLSVHPIQLWLAKEKNIETTAYFRPNPHSNTAPVVPVLRIAPHLYNAPEDIYSLADALSEVV